MASKGIAGVLKSAFTVQSIVHNLVWMALGAVVTAAVPLLLGLPVFSLAVLILAFCLLAWAVVVDRRRRSTSSSSATPNNKAEEGTAVPFSISDPMVEQLSGAPAPTHLVSLGITNHGPTASFSALLEGAEGVEKQPPLPIAISWNKTTDRYCEVGRGDTQHLEVAVADAMGANTKTQNQRTGVFWLCAPNRAVELRAAGIIRSIDLFEKPIVLFLKITNTDTGDVIKKRLWLAFKNEPDLPPWMVLQDTNSSKSSKPPKPPGFPGREVRSSQSLTESEDAGAAGWESGSKGYPFGTKLWVNQPANEKRFVVGCVVHSPQNGQRWRWNADLLTPQVGWVEIRFPQDFEDAPLAPGFGAYEYRWEAAKTRMPFLPNQRDFVAGGTFIWGGE